MKRHVVLMVCLGLFCFALTAQGQQTRKKSAATPESALSADSQMGEKTAGGTEYVPVVKYDPARNAEMDIKEAVAEANRTNKRVLVEVGGLWCIWCTHMDDFFEKQQDVLAFREKYFVTVKVNFSDENKNEALLSQYPKITGYPHIFVLGVDGKLLHSEDTGELEEGKGYNVDKFAGFLKQWVSAPADIVPAQNVGK